MGALGFGILWGSLRVRAVPCSASEDFMFYLEVYVCVCVWGVLGKTVNLNLDMENSPFD